MANDWMKLVMKMKKAHPSATLGEAMKMAKKKYKKGGAEEGEVEEPKEIEEGPAPAEGARRRRKTRRGGSKLSPLPIGGRRRKTAKKTRKH